jgi:hypothetical protein
MLRAMPRPRLWLTFFLLACLLAPWLPLAAHPIPDIPVRTSFEEGGRCRIQVEVDPRCFDADPNIAPSVLNEGLKEYTEAERQEWRTQARDYVRRAVSFHFEPLGQVTPEFAFDFTAQGGGPLEKPEDIVVITGTWETTVPSGLQGYRIRALPEGTLSVLFLNNLKGQQVERMQVLFPGETSFLLDLTGLTATMPAGPIKGAVGQKAGAGDWWAMFGGSVAEGFRHVLPYGLDHILFVLGLFLLSRDWRPLLLQVSAFTVAHTLTLGLATLGWVQVRPEIVEPIISLSIVAVAVENILHPRYTPWRLLIVFAFGLVHGLGFASALRALDLPNASLIVGLLGFNVGVEGGQLAVIILALAATLGIRDAGIYRRRVVVPGSGLIALLGLWWTLERVLRG